MTDLPRLVHDDDSVLDVAELLDVARPETECELGAGGGFAGRGVGDRRGFSGRIEVTLVRHPRSGPALIVDPQRGEGPLASCHIGDVGYPTVTLPFPTGNLPAAGDGRLLDGGPEVGDRALLRAGVLGLEDEWVGDGILAASDEDANRPLELPERLDLADRVPRAGQRCQRTVGSRRVRLLQPAAPGIVALGRDIQVSGNYNVTCKRQGDHV